MFRRGFKTSCEETSAKLRRRLDLEPTAPIDMSAAAKIMGISILGPADLPDLSADVCARLQGEHSTIWSAITVSNGNGHLIIINPSHSSARSNSSLAHEISHVILGHEPSNMFMTAQPEIALRSHNREQEEEANWLAGCLLLPREALLKMRRLKANDDQICSEFGVSPAMLRFRINGTGVDSQMRRTSTYKRRSV